MRSRFLTVLPVVTFVLTLVLAAPAWAAPNLSITKDGPARVEPGEEFVYTIVVRNTGADPATAVVVTDRLPEDVTFVESDPNFCGAIADPVDPSRQRVTCNIGVLAAGDNQRIELTVTAPNDVGEITNRATVDSAETEPETSNAVTTLVAPNLVIRKLDDPDPVRVDGLLLYTLRVTNEGSNFTGKVVVVDDLPLSKVDFVTVESSDFDDCDYSGGLVRCERTGLFEADETATVEIVVEAEEEGTVQNTATVRADGDRVDADTESTRVENRDNGGGNSDNGDDTNTDTDTDNDTNTNTDTAAETTTAQETTSANAETTTAVDGDGVRDADAFRCEFFLRVHRDDRGALHHQYRGDELVVQRFEQCISADVLADTIPNRRLPFTGGMPLLGLAALGLASLVAGAYVLRAVTRRGR